MKTLNQSLAILTLAVSILLMSCGGEKQQQNQTSSSTGLAEQIRQQEAALDLNKPDPKKIDALIVLYKRYADSLPKDPQSAVYLMKAGDLYHNIGQYNLKCHMYLTVVEKHPGFKDMDMTMYLLASSLDSELNRREEAKKYYLMYVEKFPNSIYVPDAKSRLTTIDSLTFKQLQDRIIQNAGKQAQ